MIACSGSAAVAPKATAATASRTPVANLGAGESLLDHVPASAVAALVVRSEALAMPMKYVRGGPEQQAELGAHLRQHLGVDLTRTSGIVLYVTGVSQDFDWAALFRMTGAEQLNGVPV